MPLDPKKWKPIEFEPIRPGMTLPQFIPPPPPGPANPYLRTTIPAFMQQTPYIGQHEYNDTIPKIPVFPVQAAGNPAINATAQGVSKVVAQQVVQQAIAALPPPVPAVGDGLIHGDAIWELDPGYIWMRDDFLQASVSASAVGSEMDWMLASVSGEQINEQVPNPIPVCGTLLFPNNAQVNQAWFLLPAVNGTSNINAGMPLFDYPSWKMVWIFQVGRPGFTQSGGSAAPVAFNFGQTSFYIGIGNWAAQTGAPTNTTPPRPSTFLGLRYDTDTTAPAISDTQFVFEAVQNDPNPTTRNNAQGNTFATGITPTEGTVYRLEILCTVAGKAKLSLFNGSTTASATLNVPQYSVTNPTGSVLLSQQNGIGTINTNGVLPVAGGSKITISGVTNPTYTSFNGTWTLSEMWLTAVANFPKTGSTIANANVTGTISANAAVYPYFAFGNDSQAAPVLHSKALILDFFGFLWNPGVGGGSGTPTTNKARYF